MPRAENPLAVLLWLLARDAVPWGVIEQAVHTAIDEAAGDDGAGEQGEATEGVQPLTDEDIPESGR
jgi:hypothetical protein